MIQENLYNKNLKYKIKYIQSKPNKLLYLYEKYYNNQWNIQELSRNPNLTLEFIKKNKNILQNNMLSKNIVITMQFVEDNLDINWDWTELSLYNLYINENYLIKYKNNWDFDALSINSCIDFNIIKKYYDFKWNLDLFCLNPNLTIKIIKDNPDINWDWCGILRNILVIDDELISCCPDKSILNQLSHNKNLTMEIIKKYKFINWKYYILSDKINFDFEFIKQYYSYLSFPLLSDNKYINSDVIIKYIDKSWSLHNIIKNENIKLYDIMNIISQLLNNNETKFIHMNKIYTLYKSIYYYLQNPNLNIRDIKTIQNIKNIDVIYELSIIYKTIFYYDIPEFELSFKKISNNKFLYNDKLFINSLNIDRNKRQTQIDQIMNYYISSDISFNIIKYMDYI
jgi:hypothetical protein